MKMLGKREGENPYIFPSYQGLSRCLVPQREGQLMFTVFLSMRICLAEKGAH